MSAQIVGYSKCPPTVMEDLLKGMIQPNHAVRLSASEAHHHPALSPPPTPAITTPPFVRSAASMPKMSDKDAARRKERRDRQKAKAAAETAVDEGVMVPDELPVGDMPSIVVAEGEASKPCGLARDPSNERVVTQVTPASSPTAKTPLSPAEAVDGHDSAQRISILQAPLTAPAEAGAYRELS